MCIFNYEGACYNERLMCIFNYEGACYTCMSIVNEPSVSMFTMMMYIQLSPGAGLSMSEYWCVIKLSLEGACYI